MDNNVSLNILIVGAGLGGLSAAVSCALYGHRVTILESARELAEIGAGLQITPNASRLFKRWGILEQLEKLASEPTKLTVHRYSDGKVLAEEENFNVHIRSKYKAPFIDVHRVDLQRALAERARELGVKLKLGVRVTSVDLKAPKVASEKGEEFFGDLIIAADGLWSRCRESFLGKKDVPLPTGDLAYRIVLNLAQIEDPELRAMVQNPEVHFWIGNRAHVVAYSLRASTMYNIVLLVPDDLPQDVSRQEGSVDEMRKLFQGWDPILTRFLQCVKSVDKWKLMHHEEMKAWVNDDSTFVMIGDACHPMLPYLAQGANSSMEDGAVLGKLLGSLKSRSEVPHALELFQRLRKARGEAIVRETFKQRDSFHMVDGPEQMKRDELFLSYLGREIDCDFPSRWTCPKVQPWLYGYDAEEEVAAVLTQLRGSNGEHLANEPKSAIPKPRLADGIESH